MKTTIDLRDDLIHRAKLRALAQGRALKDLVADFIRQGRMSRLKTRRRQPPLIA